MKSEPEAYSIENLRRDKTTGWGGVRNYAARNNLKAMKKGDLAFFFHSSADPKGIAGIMEIVQEAHPDPTQFDSKDIHYDPDSPPGNPRWVQVGVKFVEAFKQTVSIQELKKTVALKNMALFKYGRLSVQPVTESEWKAVIKLTAPI